MMAGAGFTLPANSGQFSGGKSVRIKNLNARFPISCNTVLFELFIKNKKWQNPHS
jgi:hypothetical protein